MQAVITHFGIYYYYYYIIIIIIDDKKDKMGSLVENVLDKQQKMLDLNKKFMREKYDDSEIRAL